MSFKPATRKRVKARIAIGAMSKSGKTLTSLGMLRGIVGPEGRIAGIDTENGAMSLYSGRFPGTKQPSGFDVQELSLTTPDSYVKAINEAAAAKYDALLIDSTSQEWGSVLEIVDGQTDKFFGGWKAATPKHNAFIRAIVDCPLHIIATIRQKDEYVIEKDANGKNAPRKVGTEMVQRKQFEFEFNAVMTMDLEHTIRVTHSAIDFLPNGTLIPAFTDMQQAVELGEQIRKWLDTGDAEWRPPQYKRAFYVNDREVAVDAINGLEREQYVALCNKGVTLNKIKRGRAAVLTQELTGKATLADLTRDEADKVLQAMESEIVEIG